MRYKAKESLQEKYHYTSMPGLKDKGGNDLPESNMGEPPSLTELPSPANLLAVKSEVLCNPENWVRLALSLCLAELAGHPAGPAPKPESTLRPRIGPVELFVVVDTFAPERTRVVLVSTLTETLLQRHLLERYIETAQPDVETDLGLNLLRLADREDVGFVLGQDTRAVRIPFVAEVCEQYHQSHVQRYKDS